MILSQSLFGSTMPLSLNGSATRSTATSRDRKADQEPVHIEATPRVMKFLKRNGIWRVTLWRDHHGSGGKYPGPDDLEDVRVSGVNMHAWGAAARRRNRNRMLLWNKKRVVRDS